MFRMQNMPTKKVSNTNAPVAEDSDIDCYIVVNIIDSYNYWGMRLIMFPNVYSGFIQFTRCNINI